MRRVEGLAVKAAACAQVLDAAAHHWSSRQDATPECGAGGFAGAMRAPQTNYVNSVPWRASESVGQDISVSSCNNQRSQCSLLAQRSTTQLEAAIRIRQWCPDQEGCGREVVLCCLRNRDLWRGWALLVKRVESMCRQQPTARRDPPPGQRADTGANWVCRG